MTRPTLSYKHKAETVRAYWSGRAEQVVSYLAGHGEVEKSAIMVAVGIPSVNVLERTISAARADGHRIDAIGCGGYRKNKNAAPRKSWYRLVMK